MTLFCGQFDGAVNTVLVGVLAERRISVDHTTLYRWVQRYTPEMEKRLR